MLRRQRASLTRVPGSDGRGQDDLQSRWERDVRCAYSSLDDMGIKGENVGATMSVVASYVIAMPSLREDWMVKSTAQLVSG